MTAPRLRSPLLSEEPGEVFSFPLYRAQLHGKFVKFVDTDVAEGFAGDACIFAESIHAVPIGRIDAELLHQLQTYAAFPSELSPDALHELVIACYLLHIATHLVIFLLCSLS